MRLFVAIELPDDIKDRLAPLCAGLRGAKWADADQMHLTLRFIGEVDGDQARDLFDALGQVYAAPFELTLAGLGDFSSRGRVATLWAGVRANPALIVLQGRIEAAVRRAGIAPEPRKFHPHVTLARFGGRTSTWRSEGKPDLGRYYLEHEPFAAGPFAVDEFVLFSSVLGSEGATYIAEATYPLGQLTQRVAV